MGLVEVWRPSDYAAWVSEGKRINECPRDPPMRRLVFFFALIVLLANGGHALSQFARSQKDLVSYPLLFGSVSAAVFALIVVRKRLRQVKGSDQD